MRAAWAFGAAAAGGAIGYFLFFWIARQGFYALALPGALMGVAASFAKCRSWLVAGALGVAGTFLGLFTEWQWAPFKADESFPYLLKHIPDLKPLTLVMVALGGVCAAWFARDRSAAEPPRR